MRNLFAPLAMKVAGGIVAVLLLALAVQSYRLNSVRADLSECRRRGAELNAAMDRQNAAIAQWQDEARARTQAAERALAEARRLNAQARPQVRRLQQSAVTPRPPIEGCTISDALKGAEGL